MVATDDSVNLLPYLADDELGRPHDYLYWRSGPTAIVIRGSAMEDDSVQEV